MTYSELLHSVKFDDIVPFISKSIEREECIAQYKKHYDILRQIAPHHEDGDNATATIRYSKPDEGDKHADLTRLEVFPMEDDHRVSLTKELIIAPDVKAPLEEIAACCLWHTFHWGFTPILKKTITAEEEDEDDMIERYKSMYGCLMPSKKRIMKNKDFSKDIRQTMKYLRRWRPTKADKKRYGSDYVRKRNWRSSKRFCIAVCYDRAILDIGEFIETLHQGESVITPPSVRELCRKLFWGKRYNLISYQTYTEDAAKRFEYFKELIVKYDAFSSAKLPGAIVCLSSSTSHPVTMEEMELIKLATQGCEEVQFCVKVDDNLAQELMISIAFYENEPKTRLS